MARCPFYFSYAHYIGAPLGPFVDFMDHRQGKGLVLRGGWRLTYVGLATPGGLIALTAAHDATVRHGIYPHSRGFLPAHDRRIA